MTKLKKRVIRKRVTLFSFLIVALMAVVLWPRPGDGFWGADAGIKTLAVAMIAETGPLKYSLPDTGADLDPGNRYRPYGPPFAVQRDGRWLAVYSPLFLDLSATAWKIGGVVAVRLLSLLGAFAVMAVSLLLFPLTAGRKAPAETGSPLEPLVALLPVLATPLLFYTFTVWEHSIFTAVALAAIVARLSEKGDSGNVLAGLFAAAGVALRPEGLLWAVALVTVRRRRVMVYLVSLGAGLLAVGCLQLLQNGTPIPLQWLENAAFFRTGGREILFRAETLLSRADFFPAGLWFVVMAAFVVGAMKTRGRAAIGFVVVSLALFAFFTIFRFFYPVPLGLLARSSGWLAVAPFAAVWWLTPVGGSTDRKLRISAALFVVAAVLLDPVPDGIHFGPRVLLPALSLGTVGAFAALGRLDRLRRVFLVGLLVVSCVNQFDSLPVLFGQLKDNSALRETVRRETAGEPLLLSGWYFGADLGPELSGRTVLLPGDGDGWVRLLDAMKRRGVRTFWHLRAPGGAGPEINPMLGVTPLPGSFRGKRWILRHYLVQGVEEPGTLSK